MPPVSRKGETVGPRKGCHHRTGGHCHRRVLGSLGGRHGAPSPPPREDIGVHVRVWSLWGNAVTPPAARDLYTIAAEALAAA